MIASSQVGAPTLTIDIPWFVPEGLDFDAARDQIIVASIGTGQLRAFQNSPDATVTLGTGGSIELYNGTSYVNGAWTKTPTVGVEIDGSMLLAAVGTAPPMAGDSGSLPPPRARIRRVRRLGPCRVRVVDVAAVEHGLAGPVKLHARPQSAELCVEVRFFRMRTISL